MALLTEIIKLREQDEEVAAQPAAEQPSPGPSVEELPSSEPKAEADPSAENPETAEDQLDLDDESGDENPDRQGLIRTVKNAHLVFKRANPDGKYSELWIYNINPNSIEDELRIKKDILAGTDIPNNATTSPDETQTYELVTMGNAQLLYIDGLPN